MAEKLSAIERRRDAAPAMRAGEAIEDLLATPLAAGLYLVATPIGNLADITLRAIAVLAQADVVYCEDTRHSAKLLQHYGIGGRTRPLHEHNEEREIDRILQELNAGRRIAVISDAGTPLLSDPGFKLVRAVAAAGLPVHAIPGPSAALAALTTSGLPTDSFFFAGFLPAKAGARRERLKTLAGIPGSLIVFEAPHRVSETLADMADILGAREAVMARELTKLHEEIARGSLGALARSAADQDVKGEIVIVAGPAKAEAVDDEAIGARLSAALEVMSLKDAARVVADELKVPKSRVYSLGLNAKGKPQ